MPVASPPSVHPPRASAVPVGLQTSATPSTTAASADAAALEEAASDGQGDATEYDVSIMHRAVPPTLYDMRVKYSATALDIAAKFNVALAYVSAHWITSRTPVIYPSNFLTSDTPHTHSRTLAPQQQQQHLPPRHASSPATSVSRFRSLDNVVRRPPLPPAQLAAYRDLARALRRKLLAHLAGAEAGGACEAGCMTAVAGAELGEGPARPEAESAQDASSTDVDCRHIFGDTLAAAKPPIRPYSSLPAVPPARVPHADRGGKPACASCGFGTLGTHADLSLSPARSAVHKRAKGLYRVARSAATAVCSRGMYTEMHVVQSGGPGGLCIGVMTGDARLDRVVGDCNGSIGLHASGSIVCSKRWTQLQKAHYCTGDTVSVHIVPIGASPFSDADTDSDAELSNNPDDSLQSDLFTSVRIDFAINGRIVYTAPLNTGGTEQPLHVAVSLYQMDSKVVLNCCPCSWKFASQVAAVCTPLNALCSNNAAACSAPTLATQAPAKTRLSDTLASSISELTP